MTSSYGHVFCSITSCRDQLHVLMTALFRKKDTSCWGVNTFCWCTTHTLSLTTDHTHTPHTPHITLTMSKTHVCLSRSQKHRSLTLVDQGRRENTPGSTRTHQGAVFSVSRDVAPGSSVQRQQGPSEELRWGSCHAADAGDHRPGPQPPPRAPG